MAKRIVIWLFTTPVVRLFAYLGVILLIQALSQFLGG